MNKLRPNSSHRRNGLPVPSVLLKDYLVVGTDGLEIPFHMELSERITLLYVYEVVGYGKLFKGIAKEIGAQKFSKKMQTDGLRTYVPEICQSGEYLQVSVKQMREQSIDSKKHSIYRRLSDVPDRCSHNPASLLGFEVAHFFEVAMCLAQVDNSGVVFLEHVGQNLRSSTSHCEFWKWMIRAVDKLDIQVLATTNKTDSVYGYHSAICESKAVNWDMWGLIGNIDDRSLRLVRADETNDFPWYLEKRRIEGWARGLRDSMTNKSVERTSRPTQNC